MKTIVFKDLEEIGGVAQAIADFAGKESIWVFKGRMGAGKTTLIKAIAQVYGIEDNVSSPTFSIVNEYRNGKGEIFYHFDFYRLEDVEEALEIGVEEYFYSGNRCWIEWAERIPELIPEDFILVEIAVDDSGERKVVLSSIVKGLRDG